MKLTEIVGRWDMTNHKKPTSLVIGRKLHTFSSLQELAEFSRENYIFVYVQRNSGKSRRLSSICENLWVGEKLLWVDMDGSLEVEDVCNRLEAVKIKGFVYYTSSYYNGGEKRVRLGVVTKEVMKPDGQAFYYAKQLLHRLGFGANVVNKVDSSIYSPDSYLAPVLVLQRNGKFKKPCYKRNSLFFSKGKPFCPLKQEELQEKLKQRKPLQKRKRLQEKGCFGKIGALASELSSYGKVVSALARQNDTISLVFKTLKERTIGGYYINKEDPWVLRHPNTKKKVRYLNEVIGEEDFLRYKEFVFSKGFRPKDVLKKEVKPDIEIRGKAPYLEIGIFKPLKKRSLFIESPTGTGKTRVVSKLVGKVKGKTILFISNNRSQAAQLYKYLQGEKLGFECYIRISKVEKAVKRDNKEYRADFIENKEQGIIPDRLICGALSLHHLLDGKNLIKKFDYVIIDEITNLPNYTVNMVPLLHDATNRFHKDLLALSLLLRTSKRVICMDGYISEPVTQAVRNISGKKFFFIRKNYKTNKRVELFITKSPDEPKLEKEPLCKKFIGSLNRDIESAESNKGKTVLLSALSLKRKAKKLRNYVKHVYKDKKLLLLTGDPSKISNLEILANLTNYLKRNNISIMVYSPAITTGVDIPQAEGRNVYHVMDGTFLSSHTHYQMTMRGRKAGSYKVLIPTQLFLKPMSASISPKEIMLDKLELMVKGFRFRGRQDIEERSLLEEDPVSLLVKGCLKYQIKMSTLLLFLKLEGNTKLSKKQILDAISQKTLLGKVRDEGLRCGIELELAAWEWERYDNHYGVVGNYINLLAREGCFVSKELDYVGKTLCNVKRVQEFNARKITENKRIVEEVLEYKRKTKNLSIGSSYNELHRVQCAQRVLHHYLFNYEQAPEETQRTSKILRKVLKKLGLVLDTEPKRVSNRKLLKGCNYILSMDLSSTEKDVYKIFRIFGHGTDRTKVLRLSCFLKLFFHIKIKNKYKVFSSNTALLQSVKRLEDAVNNMDHIRNLYVK